MSDDAQFEVRLDGKRVESAASRDKAYAAALDLKRAIPDQLVSLWDLATEQGEIVSAD